MISVHLMAAGVLENPVLSLLMDPKRILSEFDAKAVPVPPGLVQQPGVKKSAPPVESQSLQIKNSAISGA